MSVSTEGSAGFHFTQLEGSGGETGNGDEFDDLTRKHCQVWAVDCSHSMHEVLNDRGDTPFRNVIKALRSRMEKMIIANTGDTVALLLFNTNGESNPQHFGHITVPLSVCVPTATAVLAVKEIERFDVRRFRQEQEARGHDSTALEGPNNVFFQQTEGGPGQRVSASMYHVLWAVSQLYVNGGADKFVKDLLIFTDNDDPIPGEGKSKLKQKNKAIQKARDLDDMDVYIRVWGARGSRTTNTSSSQTSTLASTGATATGVSSTGVSTGVHGTLSHSSMPSGSTLHTSSSTLQGSQSGAGATPSRPSAFSMAPFFGDIVTLEEDEMDAQYRTAYFADDVQDFYSDVKKREFKKRSIGSGLLQLQEGRPEVAVGFKMYVAHRKAPKLSMVKLKASTNQVVRSRGATIGRESGLLVGTGGSGEHKSEEVTEVVKFCPYGDSEAQFRAPELRKMKLFGRPGLVVLGSKPQQALRIECMQVQNGYFLYPDETRILGSTTAMMALIQELYRMNYCLICKMIFRKYYPPSLVALFPQMGQVPGEPRSQLSSQYYDDDEEVPPGLRLFFLPFKDDIRELKFPLISAFRRQRIREAKEQEQSAKQEGQQEIGFSDLGSAELRVSTREEITLAKQLVHSLPLQTHPQSFQSPALQHHYAAVQTLALGEETPRVPQDNLKMPAEQVETARPLLKNFATYLKCPFDTPVPEKKTRGKRGTTTRKSSTRGRTKRTKSRK